MYNMHNLVITCTPNLVYKNKKKSRETTLKNQNDDDGESGKPYM